MVKQANHHAIFRASFFTGGAQFIGLFLGLLRNKVIALCLGTAGIGFSAISNQAYGIMQAASTLGIPPAGVRAVALSKDNDVEMALNASAVRHACRTLAIAVALVVALASPLISQVLFQDHQHIVDILILATGLLFMQMAAAEQTILRGIGRVSVLARVNVSASAVGTMFSIPLVYLIGLRGIVLAILASAVALYWFSKRASSLLPTLASSPEPSEVTQKAWSLAKVGMTFFGLTITGMLLSLVLSIMLNRHIGIDGNGVYQAASGLTMTIAGFILSAMGQDFYPKIVHMLGKGQRVEVATYCADQIEMGLLMALPILATVSFFAHELIALAYSRDFHAADPLVGVLAASCWARICYWPHMLCILAEAHAKKVLLAEVGFALGTALLAWFLMPKFGVAGVAIAHAVCFLIYSLVVSLIVRGITGRLPIAGFWKFYVIGLICILIGYHLHPIARIALIFVLIAYVVRRLTSNLGPGHRLTKLVQLVPILRSLTPQR
jgi:PST family polysaccharide transporter